MRNRRQICGILFGPNGVRGAEVKTVMRSPATENHTDVPVSPGSEKAPRSEA